MKKLIAVVAMTLTLGIPTLAGATTSKVQQQDLAQAQKVVQNCIAHGNMLTKHGRQGVLNCIAPKGSAPKVQACAQQQLARANLLTKKGRAAYEQALAECVVKYR